MQNDRFPQQHLFGRKGLRLLLSRAKTMYFLLTGHARNLSVSYKSRKFG